MFHPDLLPEMRPTHPAVRPPRNGSDPDPTLANIATVARSGYGPNEPVRPSVGELVEWRKMLGRGEKPFCHDIDRMIYWLMRLGGGV